MYVYNKQQKKRVFVVVAYYTHVLLSSVLNNTGKKSLKLGLLLENNIATIYDHNASCLI